MQTSTTPAVAPIDEAFAALPEIAHRLQRGQQFNVYDLTSGGYTVCLGPVTDALAIADVANERVAHMIEVALRRLAGQ